MQKLNNIVTIAVLAFVAIYLFKVFFPSKPAELPPNNTNLLQGNPANFEDPSDKKAIGRNTECNV